MKLKYLIFFILPVILFISCADDEPVVEETICGVNIFNENIFSTEMTTLQFGSSVNVDGSTKDLFMDVFTPVGAGDEKKPVVIWAFGGAFIMGERQDVQPFAEFFGEKGYVSATIDYRILNLGGGVIPDSLQAFDIAVKAMGDMKAAVRHFRMDAANGNTFNIDTDQIYVAGVSAGAITALQVAMVDESEITEEHVMEIVNNNGGIEGNSGSAENLQFSSDVAGVISLSGALYRLNWLDANDPPLFSYHGTADSVVPFGFDFVRVLTIPILPLYGSQELHQQANAVGLRNELITVEGGEHTDIYGGAFESNFEAMKLALTDFVANEVCN